jgi:hypothetical protein
MRDGTAARAARARALDIDPPADTVSGPSPDVRQPRLSIIVAFHDMVREAPRTLYTLSARYQRGVSESEYEVIAIDIGSERPLDAALVEGMGTNFRLVRTASDSSPAAAINRCARQSRGEIVCVCIDGARMLSPGIVRLMCDAIGLSHDPVIATLSFHLGPKLQNISMEEGYCQAVEDRLLESVDWRSDGYGLFGASSLAASSACGWFAPLGESNCLAVRRALFDRLGGLDERFRAPGGGFVNLDYYRRAVDAADALVILLGEGTFHQFHGGVATNIPLAQWARLGFAAEYRTLRGTDYMPPARSPILVGGCHAAAIPWIAKSAELAIRGQAGAG